MAIGQNNRIMREMPAYTIGQLFQLVDAYRRKHDIDIAEVREDGDSYLLMLEGGEIDDMAAGIGIDDPDEVADLDVHMVDDRKMWGRSQ